MGAWASAAAARDDLRRFTNDGPQDKLVKGKIVVGAVDGANATFRTFEDRLVASTLVPSVNFVDLAPAAYTVDDLVEGRFTLAAPPTANATLRARYAYQYFLDAEVDEALQLAAGEVLESDDITGVALGLKNAALNFAAHFGFNKLSVRWAQRMSEKFLLEDAPVEGNGQARPNLFRQLAQDYYKTAVSMRDSYYQRHGRREAPAWGVYKPRLPAIGPRR